MDSLKGVQVAILVDNGFERAMLTELRKALDAAGAETKVISPQAKEVRAWEMKERGEKYPAQQTLDEAQPNKFDALLRGSSKLQEHVT